ALTACVHSLSSTCPSYRILPPLLPTLLPYTTLVRSLDQNALHGTGGQRGQRLGQTAAEQITEAGAARGRGSDEHGRATCREGAEDRKSTRLNSSHVSISYAVFCLKTKKQQVQQTNYV